MTITGTQMIIARGLLGWSRAKLAVESGVGSYTITGFENAGRQLSGIAVDQLRRVLEAAGVVFILGSNSGVNLCPKSQSHDERG
jgi:transcriptional regulator with XRE-family HTH domain